MMLCASTPSLRACRSPTSCHRLHPQLLPTTPSQWMRTCCVLGTPQPSLLLSKVSLHLVHQSVWAGVSSPGRAMCLPCRSSCSGTSECPSGAVWLGDSRALLGCTSQSGLVLALQHCSPFSLSSPCGAYWADDAVGSLGTWVGYLVPSQRNHCIAFFRHTSCPVSEPFLFPVCSHVFPGSISWPLYITETQRAT